MPYLRGPCVVRGAVYEGVRNCHVVTRSSYHAWGCYVAKRTPTTSTSNARFATSADRRYARSINPPPQFSCSIRFSAAHDDFNGRGRQPVWWYRYAASSADVLSDRTKGLHPMATGV